MYKSYKTKNNSWVIEDGIVRFFLLEGSDKALMIDSGMSLYGAKEYVSSLTNLPIELINTHADPDHTAGNDAFNFAYMGYGEQDNYRAHSHTGEIRFVHEGDVIDLGNRKLEIIDIPGHTPGSIALLDIEQRALYAGDTVQDVNIYMFSKRRNMSKYIDSLCHIRDDYAGRYDTIYQSHGSLTAKNDALEKLIDAAKTVLSGNAHGDEVEVHGNRVILYKFDVAGFYCDIN